MTARTKAFIFLLIAAILWSFGGLLIKSIAWTPMAIAGVRSAISVLVLLAVIRRHHFTFSFSQIAGAVFYAATMITFVSANKLTTAANAIILQYTAPIYVALLGIWLLKEKVQLYDWIVILAGISGICLFFIDKVSVGNQWGNVLALISGITFACMIVFLRMQKNSYPLSSVFMGNVITAVLMIPFAFYAVPRDAGSWMALLALGIFQLGLSYILYSIAIKHATALEAVMIPLLEPVLNPLWVLLFLGERPTTWAFIGGSIVIFSLIIHAKIKSTPMASDS
ncbi:MAG: EamA family transporter [Sedimentisphaerales bacterium]|nr:EamA family transporter [Sedimentisphaerales bacterium]